MFHLFVHRKVVDNGKKKGKVGTKWDKGGNNKDMASLDFSSDKGAAGDATANGIETSEAEVRYSQVGEISSFCSSDHQSVYSVYLLVSSADNLCEQFGPTSGKTKCWACSGSKL